MTCSIDDDEEEERTEMVEMYVSVDNLNPRRGREISSYKTFRIPPPAVKAAKVRMLKPKASKPKSSEVYMKRYMNKGPGSAQADSHTHTHRQAGAKRTCMYHLGACMSMSRSRRSHATSRMERSNKYL